MDYYHNKVIRFKIHLIEISIKNIEVNFSSMYFIMHNFILLK